MKGPVLQFENKLLKSLPSMDSLVLHVRETNTVPLIDDENVIIKMLSLQHFSLATQLIVPSCKHFPEYCIMASVSANNEWTFSIRMGSKSLRYLTACLTGFGGKGE